MITASRAYQADAAPPGAPDLQLSFNFIGDSVRLVGQAWRIADVRSAILGISWFWFFGIVILAQMPIYASRADAKIK